VEAMEVYRGLLAARWLVLELGRDWLDAHADRRTEQASQRPADVVHDFVCFSLTKGVRSARAAALLMGEGYFENATCMHPSSWRIPIESMM